ncbi:MAG TPA: kynureninase, partial [Acidimicrobiales bacterium]
MTVTRDDAVALDREDPLAHCRSRFHLPSGVIYLNGNSLGALPVGVAKRVDDLIEREWGDALSRSWNGSWWDAPRRVGDKVATLIGAEPGEVVVGDSTSVNLYKLVAAALRLRPGRDVIVTEEANFPTDLYIAQSIAAQQGATIRFADPADVAAAFDDDVALVMLTHVNYRTGAMHDLDAVTAQAHLCGALMLWDLCHSAGAVPVDLNGARADLAVGCGYKYLNGGPGAPAFLFVAERHQAAIRSPLSGWMGHAEPFAFEERYRPNAGVRAMLCGTPPILGLAALEVGLDLQLAADRRAVEAKGQALCRLFIELVESRCADHGLVLAGPRDMAERGLHVSFAHPDAHAIVQAMIAHGVIGDFRDPDIARFGFSPLYLSY